MALRLDVKLVERALVDAGDEAFPDAGRAARAEMMRLRIPSVEAADDRDRPRIRRPYAEDGAGLAVVRDEMGAHLFVDAVVAALVEEVEVLVGEELGRGEGGVRAHARQMRVRLSLQKLGAFSHAY